MIKVTGKGNISATIIAHSKSAVDGKEIITYELEYHRFVHSELMTHRCLVGDTRLVFDLPSGTTNSKYRKYEKTIKEFHDTWHNGSKERMPSRYQIKDTSLIEIESVYTAKQLCKIVGYKSPSNIRKECRDGHLITQNPNKCKSEDHLILGADFIQFCNSPRNYKQNVQDRLKSMSIRMLNTKTGEVSHTNISNIWLVGQKEIFELQAGSYSLRGTFDHPVLTQDGWKNLSDITTEDSIVIISNKQQDKADPNKYKFIDGKWRSVWQTKKLKELSEYQKDICSDCGNKSKLEIHHVKPVYLHPELAFDNMNIVAICNACHKKAHSKQGWQQGNPLAASYQKVNSIVNTGKYENVYDLTVTDEEHNFVANDIVVHNCFSRNAASSRAIPVSKMTHLVENAPAMPIHWGKNQAGMQASEVCNNEVSMDWDNYEDMSVSGTPEAAWAEASRNAVYKAVCFSEAGYHKQITNRLLEPFQMIKVVVTATEWDNFFWLRFHKAAQPEIQELARCMLVAKKRSVAEVLQVGEWHTPYVAHRRTEDGLQYVVEDSDGQGYYVTVDEALHVSASCVAQTSYRKTDGSLEKADKVWQMLTTDDRLHGSPLESQATPMEIVEWDYNYSAHDMTDTPKGYTHVDKNNKFWSNNFCGWIQHRSLIENNNCTSFDYDQEIDETGLVITDNVEV